MTKNSEKVITAQLNILKNRAESFYRDHKNDDTESAHMQTFWNDFFKIFNVKRRDKIKYEYAITNKIDNRVERIDGLWPNKLIIEHKSLGKNLEKALEQADDYILSLPMNEIPQYSIVCDFQNFIIKDLNNLTTYKFTLSKLSDNIHHFLFIMDTSLIIDSFPVSKKAAIEIGKIYLELERTGYNKNEIGKYLTRIVYCLFADDTGIFNPYGLFLKYIESSKPDGSDLGNKLQNLFSILNTKDGEYSRNTDENLNQFPYINGGLFKENLTVANFDNKARQILINVSNENWSKVSPSIFGSLFQSVMDEEKRHDIGAHYTLEKNILKVINPLFMDELNEKFEKIKNMKSSSKIDKLQKLQNKLANLKFFDPACGAGNFLIIAYREIRRLELKIIEELTQNQRLTDDALTQLVKVNVDQFYGIDINEFSTNIAETALWLMDHLLNNEFGAKFNNTLLRIPLDKSPRIVHGDALEIDWNDVLPANQCSYIFGNPPYLGSKKRSSFKSEQIIKLAKTKNSGILDYVTAWLLKSANYIINTTKFAFVTTNSIIQGEHVSVLWQILFDRFDLEIIFAYESFKWESDAKNKASVTVVILCLGKKLQNYQKLMFDVDSKSTLISKSISPYFYETNNPNIFVKNSSKPINGLPKMVMGSKPIDKGNYIFTDDEKREFLKIEPNALKYFRPYMNADNFIQNTIRWILTLHNVTNTELSKLPHIKKRVNKVSEFRMNSTSNTTRNLIPTRWHLNILPNNNYLLIPRVTTSKRKLIPIGYIAPPIIPSDATLIIENADIELFGLLTSKMHMVWLDKIGGKLQTHYRYSVGIVYNNFPLPDSPLDSLKKYAQTILDIREKYNDLTFFDLYDPDTMKPELQSAHKKLDNAVDKLYRNKQFIDDHDRLKFLMEKYSILLQNNHSLTKYQPRRRSRPKSKKSKF